MGIFAGVVEFCQISDGGMTRARRLEFTFAPRKIFQQASLAIHITSSTCEIKNWDYWVSHIKLGSPPGVCSSQAGQSVEPETP